VSFWGSNVASPNITNDLHWTVIRGRVPLADPGVASFCPWVTLDCDTAYRHVMIKIEDRHGTLGWTRIAEWQVQVETASSLFDYETKSATVKYRLTYPQV
jgi:hypothetical protein